MKTVYTTSQVSLRRTVVVTVFKETLYSEGYDQDEYHIDVEVHGVTVSSMTHEQDSYEGAVTIANLLLDIYWNELQDTLLAH